MEKELYPNSITLFAFKFLLILMLIKILNHYTNKSFDMSFQLLKKAFLEYANILISYYEAKKKLRRKTKVSTTKFGLSINLFL